MRNAHHTTKVNVNDATAHTLFTPCINQISLKLYRLKMDEQIRENKRLAQERLKKTKEEQKTKPSAICKCFLNSEQQFLHFFSPNV